MSKEQFEHLKSTLAKINDLTTMLENLELKDKEKDESIKIYNEKQVNIITKKINKIKRSMTKKDEQINKNNLLINEYREKVQHLKDKLKNTEKESFGNANRKNVRQKHDVKIDNLMGEKLDIGEHGSRESSNKTLDFIFLSIIVIGFFLGYTIANYLFPLHASFQELIDEPLPNNAWQFWLTCCSIPIAALAIGSGIDYLLTKRHNLRIDSEIKSIESEYNKKYSSTNKRLTKIEDEINDYNDKISDLKSANKELHGLSTKRFDLENELGTVNNNLAKIDKEEKRILKMKTDLNKEIESLFDEIKHLIPHSEKF